jgi:uncharacterized protein (DUF1499 family)
MKKIINVATFSIVIVVASAMFVSILLWPTINVVETGVTPEYPEIQPHYYSTDPGRVHEEVVAAVDELGRWAVVDQSASERRVDAHRTSAIPMVDSTVEIRVEQFTDYLTQVHVRSEGSRLRGDFGQNARAIKEFFAELDDRLGAVKFEPSQEDEDEEEGVDEEAEPESESEPAED